MPLGFAHDLRTKQGCPKARGLENAGAKTAMQEFLLMLVTYPRSRVSSAASAKVVQVLAAFD